MLNYPRIKQTVFSDVCILFVCIGGFVWFRNSELEKEKQTAENAVKTKALMLRGEMEAIEDAMEVLRNDTYLNQSLVKISNIWDETMNIASKSVLNMISSNPAIHSIYVFKNGEYIIKSSNPAYPMNIAGDSWMNDIFYNSSFGILEYHLWGKPMPFRFIGRRKESGAWRTGKRNPHKHGRRKVDGKFPWRFASGRAVSDF